MRLARAVQGGGTLGGESRRAANLGMHMVTQPARRARRTGRTVMLVLDNGSAHTSQRSTAALGMLQGLAQVVWLPP